MFVSAILAAAGRGTRLGAAAPKQMIMLGERTILQRSFDLLDRHEQIEEIVIALPPDLARSPPAYLISRSKTCAHRRWRRAAAGFGRERVRAGVEERQYHRHSRRGAPVRDGRFVHARHRGGGKGRRGDRGASGERYREGSDGGTRRADRRADDRSRIDLPGADAAGVQPQGARGCDCAGARKHRTGDRRGVAGRGGRLLGAAGRRRIDEYQNHDAARSSRVGGAFGRRLAESRIPHP